MTCRKVVATVCLAVFLAAGAVFGAEPAPDAKAPAWPVSPVGFVKGYTWGWVGSRGSYLGDRPAESMRLLADTGSQWVCIGFVGHQPTRNTPEIRFAESDPSMVTDDEIRHAVKLARDNHLKVILKPVIDPADGQWRGTIEFKTTDGKTDDAAWEKWWKAYETFMLHYAAIAQTEKCELLCIGCEMHTTERFESQWRAVIGKIRKAYSGPLIYDTNWGDEEKVAWWDAVDIIGISAYYPVSTKDDTSLAHMITAWEKIRDRLRKLAAAPTVRSSSSRLVFAAPAPRPPCRGTSVTLNGPTTPRSRPDSMSR